MTPDLNLEDPVASDLALVTAERDALRELVGLINRPDSGWTTIRVRGVLYLAPAACGLPLLDLLKLMKLLDLAQAVATIPARKDTL